MKIEEVILLMFSLLQFSIFYRGTNKKSNHDHIAHNSNGSR